MFYPIYKMLLTDLAHFTYIVTMPCEIALFDNWLSKRLLVINDYNKTINRGYNRYNCDYFNDYLGNFNCQFLL